MDVKLDVPRAFHTGDGDLVCGGQDGYNRLSTCYNILTGTTINLKNERQRHISWSRSNGEEIMLLTGTLSSNTTELIIGDSTQAGFEMDSNK